MRVAKVESPDDKLLCQRVTDVLESVVGFVSDLPDRRQADDQDEGQHHSIFNCRGAFFRGQKIVNSFPKPIHVIRTLEKYCDLCDTHLLTRYVTVLPSQTG